MAVKKTTFDKKLQQRAGSVCELCGNAHDLQAYGVTPIKDTLSGYIWACTSCISQIEDPTSMDANHWRCLNDSMWSEHTAVQVMAWRMLHRLKPYGWSQDLLDMLYLDSETLSWAAANGDGEDPDPDAIKHIDSNGVLLANGDNVVLIKDLVVKGANFTAKRGTAVRNITLTHDNAEHIEGRVNGQHIVILTKYVKKM